MDSLQFENSAKEGLTFHWKIEHFSCLWHKTGESITSPVFIADSVEKTKWCLWLYPKGDLNETYVACYLQRLPSTKGPNSIAINYELSFISKNSVLQSSVTLEDIFENGQIKGKREFMKQEKFDSKLFPKDTLTVICRIWRSIRRNKWRSITDIVTEQTRKTESKEKIERVALFARTILKVEKKYLVWIIKKFCSFNKSERNTLVIMSSSDKKLMTLEFYLTEHCCEELISICISYCTQGIKYFRFNSYLLGTNGNKIECRYQEYTNECKEGTKFVLFPTKAKLLEERQIYLPNDVLSLHCECAFSMGTAFEGIEKINKGIPSPSLRNRVVESRQADTSKALKYDLESMYNQKLFCDVKLRSKSGSFEAHKGILSARSPVFRAMLTKRKECVILTDLDAGIMSQMLLYLYTDTLGDLKWESAFKLYVAADKYQIQSLKDCCSTFLVSNLTKNNVCKILVLAHMNQDKYFKKIAQDFILKHDQAIFASNEWKLLLDTHTKLVAETMHLKYSNE